MVEALMNKADEFSQAFKRKILAEDRDRLASYLDHANASADDLAGGRFAAVNKTTVTGASPISYPRLPANSPSNQAVMVGDEPSLGIDINAMDVVGEPHKQRASEGDGGLRRRGWRRL
jgi:hypothetical protein